ncbi:Gametogenetin-Binding Protein 1-Like [Manis pentadactyla]|nr:Gametogenetin-Binding Protein 1-Like [Manis pentadactyla]
MEPRLPAMLPSSLPVAMPLHDPPGLGLGDTGAQTPTPTEVLRVVAQGVEVEYILPRGSQEVLGNLFERREDEEEAAGEASGDTGTSRRSRFAQGLEVEQGCLREARGQWTSATRPSPRRRRSVCLLEGLPRQEKGKEEEMEGEDSLSELCVPGIVTPQSPLHKTFKSTDAVGFIESELKKLLAVEQESHLWKMGSQEGQELLTQPEIVLGGGHCGWSGIPVLS